MKRIVTLFCKVHGCGLLCSQGARRAHAFTLSCNTHSSDSSPESSQDALRARAFTLAEVLLTLAIIGVVAALTLPAVITKVTNDQYVTGLKKAYNTLKYVQQKAIQESGEMQGWSWTFTSADFTDYFKPHFDIMKDCGASSDEHCFPPKIRFLNENSSVSRDTYDSGDYTFMTSDGISFLYGPSIKNVALPAVTGSFMVDVNGLRGPNKWGRDIFLFSVVPGLNGIVSAGTWSIGYTQTPQGVRLTETPIRQSFSAMWEQCKTTGQSCAGYVLADGEMNY